MEAITPKEASLSARSQLSAVLVLLIVGALLRAFWAWKRPAVGRIGEAFNVAASLAKGTGFANALGPDSGPTAHITPSMVLIAGAVYRLFGVDSPIAQVILTVIAIGVVLSMFMLAFVLFGLIGIPSRYRIGSLAVLTLAPVFWSTEALDFRLWEGGIAMLTLMALLITLTKYDSRIVNLSEWFLIGAVAACLFAISPTVGVCGVAANLMFLFRNAPKRRWPALFMGMLLLLAIALSPWTIRNELVMGRPILLRDNVGLEMSLAYYPGAEAEPMTLQRYWSRLTQIHPYNSKTAYAQMMAMGGELPYYDSLKHSVTSWIIEHPGSALLITVHHIKEYMFPGFEMFSMKSGHGLGFFRFMLVTLAGVIGYSAAATCRLWLPQGRYVAVTTMVLPFTYMIVDPNPRYLWLNFAPLIYWAGAVSWWIVAGRLINRSTKGLT